MIKEQFFPTTIYGKDVKLNNNQLITDILNWREKDIGVQKNWVTWSHFQG